MQFGAKGPSGFVGRSAEVMFRTQSYPWITDTKRTSSVSKAKSLLDIFSGNLQCEGARHTAESLLAGHISMSSACAVVCSVHSCRNTSLVLHSRWAARNSSCKPSTAATLVDDGPTWGTRGTCALLSEGLHLTTSRLTTFVVYACMLKRDAPASLWR